MSRFNLLAEPWIWVITDEKGSSEQVSLIQCFQNAPEYKQLAGEVQMQNFAILRLLLAVLHTVFSRFDAQGRPYPYLELDEKHRQLAELDEDDLEEHQDNLMLTWEGLWNRKSLPEIVVEYLHIWQDRFYLFDNEHPFYQVTQEELLKRPIKAGRGGNPTEVEPKTINRTISESGNKVALFSPRYETGGNKNRLNEAELARWLILYQGVVGTGDKARYEEFEGTNSKGWIYDIGGIALRGRNLFETLLLNLVLLHPEEAYQTTIQRPC
ncbi:MAG TPA: type I-E CRISPR-associated protein Cse1/CasA, partial [Firmicutes bacterium]|nr:type I-E CRISPR-associated protein Cse1/CasA [Bacillota bacterium]